VWRCWSMPSSWQSCPREISAPHRTRSSAAWRSARSSTRQPSQCWGSVRSSSATHAATATAQPDHRGRGIGAQHAHQVDAIVLGDEAGFAVVRAAAGEADGGAAEAMQLLARWIGRLLGQADPPVRAVAIVEGGPCKTLIDERPCVSRWSLSYTLNQDVGVTPTSAPAEPPSARARVPDLGYRAKAEVAAALARRRARTCHARASRQATPRAGSAAPARSRSGSADASATTRVQHAEAGRPLASHANAARWERGHPARDRRACAIPQRQRRRQAPRPACNTPKPDDRSRRTPTPRDGNEARPRRCVDVLGAISGAGSGCRSCPSRRA